MRSLRQLSRRELIKYTGNISQIAGIEHLCYTNGAAQGMDLFRVRNGSGLEFCLTPGKCMDISQLSYKGINISGLTKNGIRSSSLCTPAVNEFDNYFSAGMLLTCGLLNTGDDCTENGIYQPIHGRIGITPAEQSYSKCYWQGDDYILEAGGAVRESRAAAHNLLLTRVVKTSIWSSELEITDTIENLDSEPEFILLLYHFNFGFPFLTPDIKILIKEEMGSVAPRNEDAARCIGSWDKITQPQDNEPENCFFHFPIPDTQGVCRAGLENRELGIGAYITFEHEYLPVLTQWKSVRSGDYILGIEPGNSLLQGRVKSRKSNAGRNLEGFGSFSHTIRLGFYDL